MKMMKRFLTFLLAIMLVCPCFSNSVYAADGLAFFTDLSTKVGDDFTITGTVADKSSNQAVIGDVKVELTYDTEYMRFVEGDAGVTANNGVITYVGSGDGVSDRVTFEMTFQALKEGEVQMNQTSATVTSSDGVALTDFTMGYSAITIEEGDPSKIVDNTDTNTSTAAVMVGETSYTLSADFSETEIPTGYTASEFAYNGENYTCIKQETSGVIAAYLVDENGVGAFFVYNETKNDFYPFEEIMISNVYSIVILDGTDEVKMPEKYIQTTIEINGTNFPVWMEPSRDGFYIFYAANNDGMKSLYLYDSVEHTYQRMETPKTAESEGKEVTGLDKILAKVEDHLIWFVVGIGCALVVLLIVVIVLSVKLKHRNLELDDLYDEYGIDLDEEDQTPVRQSKKVLYEEEDDDDYYDDEYEYEDDEYDDDDKYDQEYEDDDDYYEKEDDLAALRQDISESVTSTKSNYDSYYDEDDFEEDDYFEIPSEKPVRKDDTYEMNFIDLD